MAANVTLRLGVEGQETVRRALEGIGKDGEKVLRQLEAAGRPVPRMLQAISGASSEAQIAARNWAMQLGPIGSTLMSLGPAGLVAGAAIGGTVVALTHLTAAANRFAAEGVKMRDTAASIGVTTLQLQAIADAGEEFALSEEKITTFLQRFTALLDETRSGQGKLLEMMLKVDPALAHQMMAAKDTASAIDILARAYQKMDAAQKLATSRATFGRGGSEFGLLIESIGRQGGVAALTQSFRQSGDALDENLIKRVAQLKTEIDGMTGDARRNFESIFSDKFLAVQHRSAELWREFSRAAKEFSISGDLRRLLDGIEKGAESLDPSGGFMKYIPQVWLARKAWQGARSMMGDAPAQEPGDSFGDRFGNWPAQVTVTKAAGGGDAGKLSAEAQLNLYRAHVAVLGNAIKPTEQLKLKSLELAAAVEKNATVSGSAARGLQAFKDAQDQAAVSMRTRLGIVKEEELIMRGLKDLDDLQAKGYIQNAEQRAEAERIMRHEVQQTVEAMKIRNSLTPELTRMGIEGGNLIKQMDQFGASSLNKFGDGLAAVINKTKSLKDAFRETASSIISDMVRMTIQKTILAPIANVFSGGLSSLFGFANGGIMTSAGPLPLRAYSAGGIANSPQMALYGEGRRPEAYVPLPDGRTIPVTLDRGGQSAGHSMTINVNVSGANGDAAVEAAVNRGVMKAIAASGVQLRNYDAGLPGRINDINRRFG